MNWLKPRLAAVGRDGFLTLLLSNCILLMTAGLSLFLPLCQVVRVAREAPVTARPGTMLLVLGMRLRQGRLAGDYAVRLERARQLCCGDRQRSALVVGGRTGSAAVTEAARGREYLITRGLSPERVFVEDASRHTLENMRNARSLLMAKGVERCTLISNRYHLARCQVIARGFGMDAELCGAEDSFLPTPAMAPRLLLEAYYIHWYRTGALWSRLIRSKKSLARIS